MGYRERFFASDLPVLLSKAGREVCQKRYLHLGDQYFGAGEMSEAQRCYLRGGAYLNPDKKGYFRRLLATYLPIDWYKFLKRKIKGKS